MHGAMRLKIGRRLLPIPGFIWRSGVRRTAKKITASLEFMTEDHHRVRNFAVSEIGRTSAALAPETIATQLDLSQDRVESILSKLEEKLTFLYRSNGRAVDWAYPVTSTETPHTLAFANGERMTAA
jgi:hypothetical protein